MREAIKSYKAAIIATLNSHAFPHSLMNSAVTRLQHYYKLLISGKFMLHKLRFVAWLVAGCLVLCLLQIIEFCLQQDIICATRLVARLPHKNE